MMTRLLVINGDDFGLTPGVNRGIVDAYRDGVLTSASLLARGPAFDDAVALAAAEPALGIGCHLTLVDGDPVLAPASIPTLVGSDGRFRSTWRSFIADAMRGRVALAEMERELTAQVERLAGAGIRVSHLDSHKHIHAWPPLFAAVARLATRFDIRHVRVPVERPVVRLLLANIGRRPRGRQALENLALAYWAAIDRRLLRGHASLVATTFLGRIDTGGVTADRVRGIVTRARAGWNELMLHPGYPDAALDRVRTRLRQQRAEETAVARAPETRELVREAGITLVNHRGEPHPRTEQSRYA